MITIAFISIFMLQETVLLPSQKEEKWGYVNPVGLVIIPYHYGEVKPVVDGLAIVGCPLKKNRKPVRNNCLPMANMVLLI